MLLSYGRFGDTEPAPRDSTPASILALTGVAFIAYLLLVPAPRPLPQHGKR